VKLVFSIGALTFEGDLPDSIFHMQLIENDIADWGARAEVIAVFHTNAGHVTLHDDSYNADRKIRTGNPYEELVGDLMKRGVKIELCGATAKAHTSGNDDLLPGIEINTDAMARTTYSTQIATVRPYSASARSRAVRTTGCGDEPPTDRMPGLAPELRWRRF
jgi:hypothetical protein